MLSINKMDHTLSACVSTEISHHTTDLRACPTVGMEPNEHFSPVLTQPVQSISILFLMGFQQKCFLNESPSA